MTEGIDQFVVDRGVSAGDEWITVTPDKIRPVLGALKESGYEQLSFLTAVDHLATVHGPIVNPASIEPNGSTRPAGRFELVYQLRSLKQRSLLRIRVFLEGDEPHAPTVSDVYPNANWDERETYDMFGIVFDGHPDLTRILMPDDWVGYPLRRDYPMGGEKVDFSDDQETWHTVPSES